RPGVPPAAGAAAAAPGPAPDSGSGPEVQVREAPDASAHVPFPADGRAAFPADGAPDFPSGRTAPVQGAAPAPAEASRPASPWAPPRAAAVPATAEAAGTGAGSAWTPEGGTGAAAPRAVPTAYPPRGGEPVATDLPGAGPAEQSRYATAPAVGHAGPGPASPSRFEGDAPAVPRARYGGPDVPPDRHAEAAAQVDAPAGHRGDALTARVGAPADRAGRTAPDPHAPDPSPAEASPGDGEEPPPPQVRNGRVLLAVLGAAILLLVVPFVAIWALTPEDQYEVDDCVRQVGNEAQPAECGSSGTFVISKLAPDRTQCPDPNQPTALMAHRKPMVVLCLRPHTPGA
ncbi:MAG TPA: hypothetical protein VFY17_06670, partial [Pilimelia sp.]|nr:hypothetical protein [Pilimelia sp.]